MINFGFFISLKTFSPRPQSMETFCQLDSLDPDAVSNYNWETHTRKKLHVFKPALSARAGVVGGWKNRLEKDKSFENVSEKFEVVVTVLFP